MRFKITARPSTETITLEDFRDHAKIDIVEYDSEANLYLNTAIELFHSMTDTFIGVHDISLYYEKSEIQKYKIPWWEGTREGSISEYRCEERVFKLQLRPLNSIESVNTYDESDNATEITSSNYFSKLEGKVPEIQLKDTVSFPSLIHPYNALVIDIKAGYAKADLPEDIKTAVLQLALSLFENRGDQQTFGNIKKLVGVPSFVAMTFDKYKRKVL